MASLRGVWVEMLAELLGCRYRGDAGAHFFVEQGGNFTHDPIRSITDSAEYVKRVLLKESGQ